MQTHKGGDAATQDPRPHGRIFESLADFFSPKLRCDSCGSETRRRRCEQTGVTRPMPEDADWSRWATVEIEHICPECGTSVWVQQIPVYYSYI